MTRFVDEEFEFELRSLQGVTNVGLATDPGRAERLVVVARRRDVDTVRLEAPVIAGLYAPDLQLEVVALDETSDRFSDGDGETVNVVKAEFNAVDGSAEVTLAYGGVLGTARSDSGPLIGAAEATLAALRDLGQDLPVYLVGVTKVDTSPALPVVVTLRSLDTGEDHVGVGHSGEEVHSAATATLDALSRGAGLLA
jgi:hypothetical protein